MTKRQTIEFLIHMAVIATLALGIPIAGAYHVAHCEKKDVVDFVINGQTGKAELKTIQVCK